MLSDALALALTAEIDRGLVEANQTLESYYSLEVKKTFTWDVSQRGEVRGNLDEFRQVIEDTFSDVRGWRRAGIEFKYVESGADLHMVLASPANVAAFAPGVCSDEWSCTVTPYVAINDNRWMGATDTYNNAGETLLNYRRMVLNHETGHWLGHDHLTTCGEQGLAPIMMQQSIDLRGCNTNPWPQVDELWTTR